MIDKEIKKPTKKEIEKRLLKQKELGRYKYEQQLSTAIRKYIKKTFKNASVYMVETRDVDGTVGIPDLGVSYNGELYALELKTLTGRLKPAQIKFIEKTNNAYVVWGFDKDRINLILGDR